MQIHSLDFPLLIQIQMDNISLVIWRLNCFNKTFEKGSTAGILLSFCAKTPQYGFAQNRYT